MTPSFLVLGAKTPVGRERARILADRWSVRLEVVHRADRLIVLASTSLRRCMPSADLILLGEAYGGAQQPLEGQSKGVLRRLTRTTWGSYLAVAHGPNDCLIMVDPSGAGRAHLAADGDLALVTDALTPTLTRDAALTTTVRVEALASALVDPGTIVSAPLLHGVTPMIAGVAYSLHGLQDPTTIWAPRDVGVENGSGPELRDAVDRATASMLGGRSPLMELSGGLDSSIVAGTMADLGMIPHAINVELIGGDVDEVRYARATAERSCIDLRVVRTTDYPDLSEIMDIEQVAHPYVYGVDAAFSDAVGAALCHDADCVVTGQGGDAVFYQPATPYTTIDRFRALGMRSGRAALLEDAKRSGTSIWELLGAVASDRFRGTTIPEDDLGKGLLTRELAEGRSRFRHPWYADADDRPPGRRLQLLMLANSQMFHSARALGSERTLLHPLLTQPVLEAALAIPTWQLACGPLDRGLARQVFSDRLAPVVANRRLKGAASAFYSRTALANLPYLRERLLDGALVRTGIVDRIALERALTPEALFYSFDYPALILQANTEAWLSAWTS